MDRRSLQGKVAVITGAASGIGRATATLLAERGAFVVIADIQGTAAESVASELNARGLTAMAAGVDAGVEEQIRSVVDATVSRFGTIDILHNNAAALSPEILTADQSITDLDTDLFMTVLRVNVAGYALFAKHCIPVMLTAGRGVIINTASAGGHAAELGRPMYGTSKAAIIGLTRNIATLYGKQGIRCVSVSPGVIVTPTVSRMLSSEIIEGLVRHNLTPRAGQPEDIAEAVAFLASDAAGFITGVDLQIDGGILAHFPTFAVETASASTGQ